MQAADVCFQKQPNGSALPIRTKLGRPTHDKNPVPAHLFPVAPKENGNMKEIWKKGKQTENKETKSQIFGRDEHFST